MSLLFKVLYAAHARGTHHKLALDALARLEGLDAERWQRLFLKHAATYMAGAKAPDDVFKDFKNHVLHPRDRFWGGAPAAARAWYEKTVTALQTSDWAAAVNAAGVLSHYVTDPVHPFHTGQSEAESSIHRAFEWSTAKSYEDLVSIAAGDTVPEIDIPEHDDWLEEMLRAAALRSNAYYEKCLAHYNINQGVVDPPSGLDAVSRRIVGGLIRYAAALFATVLSRAIAEARVSPPDVSLSLDTVLAALEIPMKTLTNRLADRADREQILRMYDELKATGTVERNLPEDDRAVRDLHAAEVLSAAKPPAPKPAATKPTAKARTSAAPPAVAVPTTQQKTAAKPTLAARLETARREQSPRLKMTDDVVDAPSIGPRMAERLAPLGIATVADLMSSDPATIAARLELSYVKAEVVADWQAQTRLVLTVPGLTGTGAQLFVGAGYREPSAIAAAEPDQLSANVRSFASGAAGRRLLRDSEPPGSDQIKEWAESSRRAMAA